MYQPPVISTLLNPRSDFLRLRIDYHFVLMIDDRILDQTSTKESLRDLRVLRMRILCEEIYTEEHHMSMLVRNLTEGLKTFASS